MKWWIVLMMTILLAGCGDDNDPASVSCKSDSCQETNRTVCSVVSEKIVCSCDDGYELKDAGCVVKAANPCDTLSCSLPFESCVITNNIAACACDSGYHREGVSCKTDQKIYDCRNSLPENALWVDANENGKITHTWSSNSETYEGKNYDPCDWGCKEGYNIENDRCVLPAGDPCAVVPDPCGNPHQICLNLAGKAVCDCETGYFADGDNCINPCDPNPCENGTCIPTNGTEYSCNCEDGYVVDPENNNSCINPCLGHDTCGGHGVCKYDSALQPFCECNDNATLSETDPLICESPCDLTDCSYHGACKVDNEGAKYCECDESNGYFLSPENPLLCQSSCELFGDGACYDIDPADPKRKRCISTGTEYGEWTCHCNEDYTENSSGICIADNGSDCFAIRAMAANITSGSDQGYHAEGIRIFQGLLPDIVLIQEFNYNKNKETELRAFVDDAFGPEFNYTRGAGSIPNGIISRWPIISSGEWEDPYTDNRGFAWAQIDIPGTTDLWAVSLHLKSGDSTSEKERRHAQAIEVVNEIQANITSSHKSDFLLIGGDFNTQNRKEPCIGPLAAVVKTDAEYPVDQQGKENTNANRNKPYDWLLYDNDLARYHTTLWVESSSFPNGLVFDSRVYSPLPKPILRGDSDAKNMQHMAVMRFFTNCE